MSTGPLKRARAAAAAITEMNRIEPFLWVSIDVAIRLFHEKVKEHFGDLIAISNDGGYNK